MKDVRDTLDCIKSKTVLSTFHLKDRFFQIELDEESRDYTAIRNVLGVLRYLRLSQELNNSPAAFQLIVNHILDNRKGIDVWDFMDDVSLGTATVDVHLRSVESVFETFFDAGAWLKLAKYQFRVREVDIIGLRIDSHGSKPSDAHV